MGQGALKYQGAKGGLKLNDLYESFVYAYKNKKINAGDFVNYVTGVASTQTGTSSDQAIQTSTDSGRFISAVKLTASVVFIAHSYYDSSVGYYTLNGVVCKISHNKLEIGTEYRISTLEDSGDIISAAELSSSKVFISFKNSNNYLYGVVCTISGTTITVGTPQQLSTSSYTGYNISVASLSSTEVFIAHGYGSSYYLYGTICTISGTTITVGAHTSLVSSSYSVFMGLSCTRITSSSSVFIAHNKGKTACDLYAIVCSTSGTTITAGTDTLLDTTTDSGLYISTCSTSSKNAFVCFSDGAAKFSGIVCSISSRNITAGTVTIISSHKGKSSSASSLSTNSHKILIGYDMDSSNKYLGSVLCTIIDTNLYVEEEKQLITKSNTAETISVVGLTENIAVIFHSYSASRHLYGMLLNISGKVPSNTITTITTETQVIPASKLPFDGIALTSGEGGTSTTHKDRIKIGYEMP